MGKLTIVDYDREFLSKSMTWLNDPEIKEMVMASDIDTEIQEAFFQSLPYRDNYFIFGVCFDGFKIGVVGLKNVDHKNLHGEYWGYIGEKELWGQGLGQQMMMEIESLSARMGLKKIFLSVSQSNNIAIRAYLKFGFVEVSVDDDIIVMEKVVNG